MTPDPTSSPKLRFDQFSAWFDATPALRDVNLAVFPGERLAVIGPAGSGKTTLLRSLNRLHDLTPGFRHQGRLLLDGRDIFSADTDVTALRHWVGLVSATTEPLPGTIFDNIGLALRLAGERDPQRIYGQVERGLRAARLWDEVKDRLHQPAQHLNTASVKRLSLARVLALEPEVLLFDEPCAGLDHVSATLLEDTIEELKSRCTIVFATNDIRHAARASDRTAFFLKGELVECGPTRQIVTRPAESRTADFITERF